MSIVSDEYNFCFKSAMRKRKANKYRFFYQPLCGGIRMSFPSNDDGGKRKSIDITNKVLKATSDYVFANPGISVIEHQGRKKLLVLVDPFANDCFSIDGIPSDWVLNFLSTWKPTELFGKADIIRMIYNIWAPHYGSDVDIHERPSAIVSEDGRSIVLNTMGIDGNKMIIKALLSNPMLRLFDIRVVHTPGGTWEYAIIS